MKNKEEFIEVNSIRFYYNSDELEITDKILNKIQKFYAEDKAYSMYIDPSQGLVIY